MRRYAPLVLVAFALVTAMLSLFGDDSYARLQLMRRSLEAQQRKNSELRTTVNNLRQEVTGLQHDDRALEKAARNELGLARPNELIFIFEHDERGESAH